MVGSSSLISHIMKLLIRNISILSLMLLFVSGAWAGSSVNVISQVNGGEITADFQTKHIQPIVVEVEDGSDGVPLKNVTYEYFDFADIDGNPIDLSNAVVNDVLYTLPCIGDDDPQGFSGATSDAPACITISSTMTEADIARADQQMAGTKEYAETFKGVTLLLPAGNGRIRIIAQTDPGVVLYAKIGDESPISISKVTFDEETWITYECPIDTYVKFYMASQKRNSRRKVSATGDNRATPTVRLAELSVLSSALISLSATSEDPAKVMVYELTDDNYADEGLGIVLGTVCGLPVTDLGSSVFKSVEEKDRICYIDMSDSAIQGLGDSEYESGNPESETRLGGLLEGFSDHTLVFLPYGNSDGGDSNIIIDGTCSNLMLDDNFTFCTPMDFTASSVSLSRTFAKGRATTLILPFDISAFDANALGTFHRFKKMEDDVVLFDEAEIGSIEANTPYVFVPDVTELTAQWVDVKAIDSDDPALSDVFFGNYTRQLAPVRSFVLTPVTNVKDHVYGQFLPMEGDDMALPFSAYLRVDDEVAALNLEIGTEIVNAIPEVNDDDLRSQPLYNLGGQRVAHPGKGLYISNGRKIVLK